MSDRYPGGIISATAPEPVGPTDGEGGSAPGVWTLEQQVYYAGIGQWPKGVLPKELYSWGRPDQGRLGDNNSTIRRSSPVQIGSDENWLYLGQGGGANFGNIGGSIKTDGTLWIWGNNGSGQLGDGTTISRSSPVQIGALTNWYSLGIGTNSTVAIKTNGTMWSWGQNGEGQLGQNNRTYKSSPVQIGSETTWSKIGMGRIGSVAIKTDGTMWAWGENNYGQLGQNNVGGITNRSSPVQIGALTTWLTVGNYYQTPIAIKTDGTLWGWGRNANETAPTGGLIGDGTTINRSSPVQVGALTNWSVVESGYTHTMAIKTDGTLWGWAQNPYGQLGNGGATTTNSPVQSGAETNWKYLAVGYQMSAATKTDNTLWCFGRADNYGQLGQNNVVNKSSPVQVGSNSNWNNVACGIDTVIATTKG